jgi:hypothetical protein
MGWILDLFTQLGITLNYSAITDPHILEFTTALAKPFLACCVFNNRSLATASNSGNFLASRAQVLLSQPRTEILSNPSCQLPTPEFY